ncbi:MAG: translation initiation factor IF-3 [Armatimonadia bacterium]|nr:translation initiation factor IF-3 [Armatimonadia bacterium]
MRAREIRVIDDNGDQLGIMSPREALAIAQERDLDLIEVAPQAKPPVCRIMDYGRWKYEQRKKEKEAQKQSKSVELKTVRIRPHTDDHDFATKERKARKFLEDGKKVRVSMLFRGREMAHQDLARKKVLRMGENLSDVGDVERRPSMEGRQMSMIINPKSEDERKRAKAKAEAEAQSSEE